MSNAEATVSFATPAPRGLHLGLWATQLLLAATFLGAGGMKLTAPIEELRAQMPWVDGSLGGLVRFIGASEVLGGIGLILPGLTGIQPRLTALAAAGLATVMLLASITHLGRGEFGVIGANAVLGGLALFVVWGRTQAAPFEGR